MYQSIPSFEYLFFSSSSLFFFSIYLPLDLLILRVNFYFVSKFLFFVLFRMVWVLVTVNILKYSACYRSHTLLLSSWKTLLTQTFFSVPNETLQVLVTRVFGDSL